MNSLPSESVQNLSCLDDKDLFLQYPFLHNPIFIFGAGRSGTTLLHGLVDNHPQLLVWPFEEHFYTFWDDLTAGNQNQLVPLKEALVFLKKENIGLFGTVVAKDTPKSIDLTGVDPDQFWNFFEQFGNKLVSHKFLLMALIASFYEALKIKNQPIAWVCQLQFPSDLMLTDFPNAKFIWMRRDPLETFSSKKAYTLKGKITWLPLIYWPGYTNRRYKWGLLELALAPVVFLEKWFARSLKHLVIELSRLQQNTKMEMQRFCEYVGIQYHSNMSQQTILGIPHGSTLSSGQNSQGQVIHTQNIALTKGHHLTDFEKKWAQSHLDPSKKINCITDCLLNFDFYKPLYGEWHLPPKKYFYLVLGLPIIYLYNRLFFLFYSTKNAHAWKSPYTNKK